MKLVEIREQTGKPVINLVLDVIGKQKQAIVFASTKRGAEKTAEEIAAGIRQDVAADVAESVLNALPKPTRQCERLAKCVRKGIAFHHAGLHSKQKELVEDSFREGKIRIICATPTLAFGLDLPAWRVIIKDVKRYEPGRGLGYIPVLEFLQFCGRAGRPRFDKEGEAIAIAKTESEKDEIYERYIRGVPEDIFSKLAVEPVLRTYLLSLISIGFVKTSKEIVSFFGCTFWAHQFRDMKKLESGINRVLALLEEWGFVQSDSNLGFVSADNISRDVSYKATFMGKRVAELYIDPLTANHLVKALQRASSLKKIPLFSFLQAVAHTLEMRPLTNIRAKECELVEEKLAEHEHELLEAVPLVYELEYDDYLASVRTAMLLEDWADECDDEILLERYNIRPGETRTKLDIADWLLYAMHELAVILQLQDLLKEIGKARIRIKYGVKEELLPLLRLSGIGRVRARILYRNNLKTVGDIKKADITALTQLLGRAVAVKLMNQLGETLPEPPKETKRKGQMGLGKYC